MLEIKNESFEILKDVFEQYDYIVNIGLNIEGTHAAQQRDSITIDDHIGFIGSSGELPMCEVSNKSSTWYF